MTERPEDLETLMKGFVHMQGCHFCFVGPSLDARPLVSRSTSSYAALNPLARLASVISSDKSPHVSTPEVVGDVPPREGSGPVPCKIGSGEPGSLASEIGRKGASTVHAEHVLVTRLVQTFVQRGFKYVSRLDGGFRELEKRIRCMDTFAQDQLLLSSPVPASAVCQDASLKRGFNLITKLGRNPSSPADFQDGRTLGKGADCRFRASPSTATLASPESVGSGAQAKKKASRIKTTSSAAVSTLTHHLMHLRAVAKDAVSLSMSSTPGNDCNDSKKTHDTQ
ncbi:hypothetical protein PsorP6_014048 [Peronosclerospora sorghi]|uniref:Uncharacterized protein n=1 Tax=Peronosclerospora sorghi TaxID=230839 RepID=A0ACC0VHJ2_9STRA|nr:hypothetical protein PsorP6_014048 [Peronosclerospora sorghi]